MHKSLQELAELTHATLVGEPSHLITGVEELSSATSSDASFLAHPRYLSQLSTTQAGVICIDPSIPRVEGKNYLITSSPSATFQLLVELFKENPLFSTGFEAIHPSAVVHPTASLGPHVTLGPYVVVDAHCRIGAHTVVRAHATLYAGVTVGEECFIHSHVTIREGCQLGHRVVIQPGAVIGGCGFGYTTDGQGVHHKQQQRGIVVLEDEVEIGANTTIDRARFKETRIGRGTKIDNLVQVGHNVQLGKGNLIVSQTGISGSVKTGHHVVMGGQTGTVGHLEIADRALFAARSGIKKSITAPGNYGGNPAIPLDQHQREQVHLRNVHKVVSRLTAQVHALEKTVDELQSRSEKL